MFIKMVLYLLWALSCSDQIKKIWFPYTAIVSYTYILNILKCMMATVLNYSQQEWIICDFLHCEVIELLLLQEVEVHSVDDGGTHWLCSAGCCACVMWTVRVDELWACGLFNHLQRLPICFTRHSSCKTCPPFV